MLEAFDTGYLVHIAMLGYVLGFLFRDQIILRLLVLVGTVLYIAYYYFHPAEPLWGAIYASLLIGAATLIGLFRVVYNRLQIGISAQHWPIFETLKGLEPGEFRRLIRIGEVRQCDEVLELTREGETPENLYFIMSGDAEVEKGDRIFPIGSGEFVGEISFVMNAPASATVRLPAGGVFVQWPQDALRAEVRRCPQLQAAFEALIGRDMARKIAVGVRIPTEDAVEAKTPRASAFDARPATTLA